MWDHVLFGVDWIYSSSSSLSWLISIILVGRTSTVSRPSRLVRFSYILFILGINFVQATIKADELECGILCVLELTRFICRPVLYFGSLS